MRRHIEWALRQEAERFPDAIRRGRRMLFAVWDDRRPSPDALCYEIADRSRREGWSESLVRTVAQLYRPQLTIRGTYRLHHPLSSDQLASEDILHVGLEYPSPHQALSIPDIHLRYAIQQFRANL